MEIALVGVAAVFALLSGVNDGGTIVAMGLKISSLRLVVAIVILTAAVVAAPLLLGTGVATTLAGRLVSFQGRSGQAALLAAIVSAVGVVAMFARLSLPTSLTLALVGGITGAGWVTNLTTSWRTIAFVLLMSAVAPSAGAVLAWLLFRVACHLSAPRGAYRKVRLAHQVAFGLLCLAYGANDGQKMLAVFLAGAGATSGQPPPLSLLAAIGMLFLMGALTGVRRFSDTLAKGMVAMRPTNGVAAEFSAAVVVLLSAGVGAPVSMTQAVAGGLVGTGISEGYRRVRWKTTLHIAMAWALTLPAAFGAAAAVGVCIRVLGFLG